MPSINSLNPTPRRRNIKFSPILKPKINSPKSIEISEIDLDKRKNAVENAHNISYIENTIEDNFLSEQINY